MAKIIKKKNCKYSDGYIIDKKTEEIIGIPVSVVRALNELELMKQKTEYLASIPEVPEVKAFEFKSEFDNYKTPYLEVDPEATPLLTEMAEETKKLMDEKDTVHIVDEINRHLGHFAAAFRWVALKKFTDDNMLGMSRFDLLTLGNPLKLDEEDLLQVISDYVHAQHGIFRKQYGIFRKED